MTKFFFFAGMIFFLAAPAARAAPVWFGGTGVRCTPDNPKDQIIELSTIGLNGERYPGKGSGAFTLDNRYKTPDSYVYEWESQALEVFGKTGVGELRFDGYDHHIVGTYHCADFDMN